MKAIRSTKGFQQAVVKRDALRKAWGPLITMANKVVTSDKCDEEDKIAIMLAVDSFKLRGLELSGAIEAFEVKWPARAIAE